MNKTNTVTKRKVNKLGREIDALLAESSTLKAKGAFMTDEDRKRIHGVINPEIVRLSGLRAAAREEWLNQSDVKPAGEVK